MKQTAVEWLVEQIKSKADNLPTNTKENRRAKGIYVDCLMMARQAKAMEKEQIIEAVNYGCSDFGSWKDAEQYYNETYSDESRKL
jgi:hypothetical protein